MAEKSDDSHDWVNTWTRHYGVQYSEVLFSMMGRKGNGAVSVLKQHLFYPDNKNTAHFVRTEEWEGLLATVERMLGDESALDKEISDCEKSALAYISAGKTASEQPLENLENSQLLQLYETFREKWIHYSSYVWSFFATSEVIAPKTEKFLQEKSEIFTSSGEYEKFLKYVVTPMKKASILSLNDELGKVKRNHCEEKLEEICEKYLWIPCLDMHCPPWDKEDVKQYYKTHDFAGGSAVDGSVLEPLNLSEDELSLIELNRKMAYLRELRDEYRRRGIYHAYPLFREIGRRMGLDVRQLSYTTIQEVRDFLTSGRKPDTSKISERLEGFMVFEKNDEIVCVSGKDVAACAAELDFTKKEIQKKEIKGRTGSKGKAVGRARIVLHASDLPKVSEGDILVGLTTGPSYVPAMAKAAAFVTDQGGITAHAAIVAREMKKPCIVGTQNATTVLKDGELVEVDADSGIVRKLEE